MRSHKRFWAALLFVTLGTTFTLAQERRTLPDVTILIQQQQVRFIAQRTNETLHLQIFDPSGALVYDSGAVFQTELDWPLLNGSGEPLKSGLYAYALTLKETGNETSRVRRGHFIVDRAQDRDAQADKLWVTSQNENGLGVELTAAHDESVTVAGATLRRDDKSSAAGDVERDQVARDKTDATSSNSALAPNTIGYIAKFIGANNQLGDSIIEETPGNLNVNGTLRATLAPNTANNGLVVLGTPNSEAGVTITKDAGRADFRFNGSTLKLVAGPAGGPPSDFSGVAVTTSGLVGIGRTNPQTQFHVGAGTSSIAASRVDAVFAGNRGDAGIAIAQNSGVNVLLQASGAGGYLGTTSNHPLIWRTNDQDRVVLAANGNLGIGTGTPATKLHVEGAGFVESTIKSTNERAILALDSGVGGRYVYTLESGLSGTRGLFGIYDRNANLPRLTIDAAGLVSVKSLALTGGADLAENFDIRSQTQLQPGMVVTIDAAHPGQLQLSRRAYDRRVAGVISGAGGIQPGMRMGQTDSLADGQHPVALTGRVYVWVDATRGAIQPGDLLTTSATPGHAMRATNAARAQGAILGKAMTALKAGKGLVLVLVTLQ